MRLDPDHVRKLDRAVTPDGDVKLDIDFMRLAFARLSLWETGMLGKALAKAASRDRRTIEQRILLALFVHNEKDDEMEVGDAE